MRCAWMASGAVCCEMNVNNAPHIKKSLKSRETLFQGKMKEIPVCPFLGQFWVCMLIACRLKAGKGTCRERLPKKQQAPNKAKRQEKAIAPKSNPSLHSASQAVFALRKSKMQNKASFFLPLERIAAL